MRLLAFLVAVVAAMLVFGPYPPSGTMINQLLATGGWGLVLLTIPVSAPTRATMRAAWPLLAVFGIAGAGCASSIASGMTPASAGLCVLGVLAMAAMVTLHGAGAGTDGNQGGRGDEFESTGNVQGNLGSVNSWKELADGKSY